MKQWVKYEAYTHKSQTRLGEYTKMNINEAAQAYEPTLTKNVADLASVPIDVEIVEETRQKANGEDFTLNVIEVEGVKYRVPISVIAELKVQLSEKPDMKAFKVIKSGSGKDNTKYSVIAL